MYYKKDCLVLDMPFVRFIATEARLICAKFLCNITTQLLCCIHSEFFLSCCLLWIVDANLPFLVSASWNNDIIAARNHWWACTAPRKPWELCNSIHCNLNWWQSDLCQVSMQLLYQNLFRIFFGVADCVTSKCCGNPWTVNLLFLVQSSWNNDIPTSG